MRISVLLEDQDSEHTLCSALAGVTISGYLRTRGGETLGILGSTRYMWIMLKHSIKSTHRNQESCFLYGLRRVYEAARERLFFLSFEIYSNSYKKLSFFFVGSILL